MEVFIYVFQTMLSRVSSGSQEATTELSRQVKKVTALGSKALQMYERLLDSFRTPATGSEPEFYEERWLRPVLVSRYLADKAGRRFTHN